MATLNRFPLLGLWAEETARRIGYTKTEAESLGHAYAVLYAIRAQRLRQPAKEKVEKAPRRKRPRAKTIHFGGDDLEATHEDGEVRGLVGGEQPQTPQSYQVSVRKKFPPGYYATLQKAFRQLLRQYPPSRLDSRLVYNLYDEWKRECGKGRMVDLEKLLTWCRQHAEGPGKGQLGKKRLRK